MRRVIFVCSVSVPSYTVVGNAKYPNIIADYEKSFRALRAYEADAFFAPHAGFFAMQEKKEKLDAKPASNPFLDRAGYRRYLNDAEADFRRIVAEQSRPQGRKPAKASR